VKGRGAVPYTEEFKKLPQAGEEEASAGKEAAARTEGMKQRRPREDRAELLRRTFD
jgi:acyl-CoA reductase-like NAD-dependent aldehyde dehydrogenase